MNTNKQLELSIANGRADTFATIISKMTVKAATENLLHVLSLQQYIFFESVLFKLMDLRDDFQSVVFEALDDLENRKGRKILKMFAN